MSKTAPALADLTPDQKRALLERLLQRQGAVCGLSYGQQALWFLSRMAPDSAAYNCSIAIRIRSRLDARGPRRALQALIERHAALRTTFTTVGGEPIQRVQARVGATIVEEDAAAWSEDELTARVEDAAHRPFDLERDALLRATLFARAHDDHVLLLTFHHIIGDFMSFALLFDELLALWRAEQGGTPALLPPVAAPYADYVRWQAALVGGPEGARQRAYWERQLAGELPRLALGDKPRPAVQTDHGAVHAFTLDAQLAGRLRALARAEKTTLYVVLLAAFQAVLHRYTGEDDILVGSFAHGRTSPEFARTIGYFVNPVVVRTSLAGDPTVAALLGGVRQTVLDALEHQDYPFPLLVERLGGAQDSSYSPLFQVAFNMLQPLPSEHQGFSLSALSPDVGKGRAGVARLDLDGLLVEPFPVRQRWVQFDLTLTFDDTGDALNGFLEYNTDLFLPETILGLTEHLRTFLENAAARPSQRVWEVPLLTVKQQQQILGAWNGTEAAYPEHLCLHQLIEQQAARTPRNVAVVGAESALTYAELETRANQLAHHLRALGVGADVPVGVCVDRSPELVVALLGVLKAGGAYLPLDTDAPSIRLGQLLADARAPVCVVQEHTRTHVPSDGVAVVRVDDRATLDEYPTTAPTVPLDPDNLVSLYYTSGSTGRPKGVANTHRGWVNRMAWMQGRYGLLPDEAVLHKTTLTFDDAAVELFWPLMVGARVALLEPGLHRDPQAILDAAIRHGVAVAQFVPSMLALFLDICTPEARAALSGLRHVISSGEALRAELVARCGERLGCALHNHWGPTEVSIDATAHACDDGDGSPGGTVPIGRPLANTRVYLLDAHLQPVPPGVPGDLYLAGVGLARGYLNAAERTAEAFVPHPFERGAVMYRTGDRGRLRPDGAIVFLGRDDDQVKIRGQRVELAEIEATLAAHPAVKDCAVVALKQPDGYRLVAYAVGDEGGDEDDRTGDGAVAAALRAFMRERLPEYMVPGWFVLLDRLPLTASGKVDRRRLPDPGDDRPALEQVYSPPSTPTEAVIAGVWQRVLGLARVGSHDGFFELGGHSLDATRAVSRINQELHAAVSLREFFESPTVAALARRVDEAARGETAAQAQDAIPRLPRRETYEVSHAQERYWFQYQLERGHAYGALLALEMAGPLDREALVRALDAFVARHGVLRTTFAARDGRPCQVVHDDARVDCRYDDLSGLATAPRAAALAQAVVREKQTPFDLGAGPLLRTALFKTGEHTHRLLLSLHPVTFDGWSVAVLVEDLKALYHAFRTGKSAGDLPAALQYVDYAAWHNQRLAAGDFEGQRSYWLEHLAEAPSPAAPPADFPLPPPHPEAMVARLTEIDRALTARLHGLARAQGATLFMALLAGLDMWLAHASGQTDITVGSPLSGRTRAELEGVFGVLWNPVALRTDLAGNPSYLQVLERTRRTALGAYANQDYPFDLVVGDLRRRGREADLYAVVLVLQNATPSALSFDDLAVQLSRSDFLLEGRDPTAELLGGDQAEPYDLHMEVFERDGELGIVTRYNPRRFRAATVDGFLAQFAAVLERATSDPRVRLSQLDVVDAREIDDLFGGDERESA